MKRWIAAFLGLALTMGMTVGCQQKCFMNEKDFYGHNLLAGGLEDGSLDAVQPTLGNLPPPATVDLPDRPARTLTLQEAIAIGLENGTAASRNGGVNTPGTVDDSPAVNTGGSLNSQSDRVRVLALQPAIAGTSIEAALARFDAISVTSITGTTTDEVVTGLNQFNNGQTTSFNSSIVKALASGGVVNTSFQTSYTLLTNPPANVIVNPNYTARLTFGFEQPLLRGFGTEINQLLNRIAPITGVTLPAQAATGYNNEQANLGTVAGQPVEGILLARLRFDQARAEFERQMHNLLLNVEVAYWNLYEAYGTLYANENVLRVLHKTWVDNYYKAQLGNIASDVLAQIRGQYEEFRGERTNSLGQVLNAERNLRGILGMQPEDGTRLVPVTPPTLAAYQPNWEAALNDALIHRPELVLARENLRAHQLILAREKNNLQPDLRFIAQYQPVGTGNTLFGTGTYLDSNGGTQQANAFRGLVSDHFNDWTVGLNLNIPLGYRFEHASIRSAKMQLAQALYVLKDQEDRVTRTVAQQYQELNKWYRLIEDRRAERRAYGEALTKKFKLVELGKKAVDLDLLDTQRRLALALTKEYQAIGEYNNTLARMEFARGTIMQHDNVVIAEHGLPACAQVKAVDYERERTKAIILREKPDPIAIPGVNAADPGLPRHLDTSALPKDGNPNSLPANVPVIPGEEDPKWTPPNPQTTPMAPMPNLPSVPAEEPKIKSSAEPAKPPVEAKDAKTGPIDPPPLVIEVPAAPAPVVPLPTVPPTPEALPNPPTPVGPTPTTPQTTAPSIPPPPLPSAPVPSPLPAPPTPSSGSQLPPPPPLTDIINGVEMTSPPPAPPNG